MSDVDVQVDQPTEDDTVMSLDDATLDQELKLHSSDNETFTISKRAACLSKFVLAACTLEPDVTTVEVPKLRAAVLKKVVKYLKYRATTPAPTIDAPIPFKVKRSKLHTLVARGCSWLLRLWVLTWVVSLLSCFCCLFRFGCFQ
jgi:hypothetical protein